MCISVDFPEPEAPTMATYSPSRMARDTPLKAGAAGAPPAPP